MNSNGENSAKNEMNEQKLEQVAGGTEWATALYRCPVCNREQKRTTIWPLPAECMCPCGATMKQVPGSITKTVD